MDEDRQHRRVRDEGERVEQEERAEALRRDEAADDAADADAEVHHHALHRECRRALHARRETGEQRRLRRPEGAVADPGDRRSRGSPARGSRRTRTRRSPSVRKPSAIVSIRLPPTRSTSAPATGPATRLTPAFVAEDQPGDAEPDPALVVQVDEQERDDEAVPERVHQPAHLQELHLARQPRVQAGEEAPHRETVAPTWSFLLDPDVTFLNHGSYGACPAPVFERYQELQRELERNPVEFLGRRFHELTAEARAALAGFVGARRGRSRLRPELDLRAERGHPLAASPAGGRGAGDEARVRRRDAHLGVRRRDARLRRARAARGRDRPAHEGRLRQPHHLADGARACRWRRSAPRRARPACSRSWTARTFPASCRSISVASARTSTRATATSGSARPKGAGFLWARPEHQDVDRPARRLVGLRRGLRPPPRLAGHARSRGGARSAGGDRGAPLASIWSGAAGSPPRSTTACRRSGPTPAPQMWASEVDAADPEALQRRLFDEHRIEVVVQAWEGKSLLRVSIGPYNEAADVERAARRARRVRRSAGSPA